VHDNRDQQADQAHDQGKCDEYVETFEHRTCSGFGTGERRRSIAFYWKIRATDANLSFFSFKGDKYLLFAQT
jgi:hypothetical protein